MVLDLVVLALVVLGLDVLGPACVPDMVAGAEDDDCVDFVLAVGVDLVDPAPAGGADWLALTSDPVGAAVGAALCAAVDAGAVAAGSACGNSIHTNRPVASASPAAPTPSQTRGSISLLGNESRPAPPVGFGSSARNFRAGLASIRAACVPWLLPSKSTLSSAID